MFVFSRLWSSNISNYNLRGQHHEAPTLSITTKVDLNVSWTDDRWTVNESRITRLKSRKEKTVLPKLLWKANRQISSQMGEHFYGKNVKSFCTSAFQIHSSTTVLHSTAFSEIILFRISPLAHMTRRQVLWQNPTLHSQVCRGCCWWTQLSLLKNTYHFNKNSMHAIFLLFSLCEAWQLTVYVGLLESVQSLWHFQSINNEACLH